MKRKINSKVKLKNKLSCPICESKDIFKYTAMKGYKLARCNDCTLAWDPYHTENVLAQYNKNYFQNENPKGGYSNYFEGMKINRKTFADRLNKIAKKLKKKSDLLDVGSALGDCLIEAKKSGWTNIMGLEVSKFACDFAKKRGLKVKNTTLEESRIKSDSFNVLTYQDVIEHIENPLKELKLAHKVLKKAGYIFLVTPDVGGWWHKILGSLWYHYKPGEHIMYFSQKSLSLALKKSKFKNIETRITYHVLSVEYVLNRLSYYSPFVFNTLLKVVRKTPIKNYAFRAYTGEIEAWGQK